MNHFPAFIDSPCTSSVPSPTFHPGRSISHLNRHGSSPTRLAAFPAALLFEAVAEAEPQLFAESSITGSNVAYATEFSATVDPSASSAVLFVMLVFGALKFRIDSISSAAANRMELAEKLKVARIRRITGEDGIGTEQVGAYAAAELAYRDALDRESRLRTVLPGIEMMSPRSPVEDMRKESRELLPDLKSQYREESDRRKAEDLKPTYYKEPEKFGGRHISVFELLMLSVVGLSQIALLVLFTYDPMQSSVYSSSFMTAFNS